MGVFNQDFTPELSPFSLLWPGLPINLGNFWPQPPRPKETTGKIEGFKASTFFVAKIPWGELWGKFGMNPPPPSCPMVTFGLGGPLLPNFGPKGPLSRSPNFWWPGGGHPNKIWELGPNQMKP